MESAVRKGIAWDQQYEKGVVGISSEKIGVWDQH